MNLNELILEIKKIFENKYDNILSQLLDLIEEYEHTDWKDYVEWNEDKYNKKTVYQDDNFEIVIISWKIYQETRVHDHPEKGCVMRVLEGSLMETEYLNVAGIQKMSSNILHKDDINWKRGKKLLHKICALKNSISMHIYCPSKYVAKFYD
jgi:predicted metal-dependent enzyme (double-stranded beta helix superfamily)